MRGGGWQHVPSEPHAGEGDATEHAQVGRQDLQSRSRRCQRRHHSHRRRLEAVADEVKHGAAYGLDVGPMQSHSRGALQAQVACSGEHRQYSCHDAEYVLIAEAIT